MKKFFSRVMLILSMSLIFTFASCSTSDDDDSNNPYGSFTFPTTTEIESEIDSNIYRKDVKGVNKDNKPWIIKTTFLKGWTDIPFLSLEEMSNLLTFINDRGYNFYPVEGEEGVYKYSYYQDDAGTKYPTEWKDDYILFDAKNQTISSNEIVRILTYKSDMNNGIPSEICGFVTEDTFASPIISESDKSVMVKENSETVIDLTKYCLRLVEIKKEVDNKTTKELYIPFQVIANLYSDALAFNGKDYFLELSEEAGSASRKEYAKGFNNKPRTNILSEFNYQTLCLMFDTTYCLKNQRTEVGKTNFDFLNHAIADTFGTKLRSLSTPDYDDAFAEFLLTFIDDGGHTWVVEPSLWGKDEASETYESDMEKKFVTGRNTRTAITERNTKLYNDNRKAANGGQDVFYVDDMAVIVFDGFVNNDPTDVLNAWSNTPEDWNKLASTNTYAFLVKAFEDIANRETTVKNVVFDLSNNGGGELRQCMLAISFMKSTSDFYLPIRNILDGSVAKLYYTLGKDLVQNYNFYVMTSPVSFSCGNYMPSICKYQLGIPIIGKKSAGGGGTVKFTQTADGALFKTSGSIEMCRIDEDENYQCIDTGVPVDLELEEKDFYAQTESHPTVYGAVYEKLAAKYPDNF